MKLNVGKLEHEMVQKIIGAVCLYYDLSEDAIKSKKRTHNIVHARQLSCYLIRKYTAVSKLAIGKIYFNQDHSAVINSLKIIENEIKCNSRGTNTDIKNLTKIIEGQIPQNYYKVDSKFAIQVKCTGMKDEFFGFWDDSGQANRALQDRIKSIIGNKRCLRSTTIKVKIIQNA